MPRPCLFPKIIRDQKRTAMEEIIRPQRAFSDFRRQPASSEEVKMAAWGGYPLLEPLLEPVYAMDHEVNDGSSMLT